MGVHGSVHSPEVGSVAGSGAVGVCSSGFSSAGVSFLGSGAGFFFRFRLRLCFRLRCGGFRVGCWRSACGGEQEQWDDAGGCDGSGLGHGRLPSLVLFSSLVGAWFWVRFSKKILPILCNLLVYNLHLM